MTTNRVFRALLGLLVLAWLLLRFLKINQVMTHVDDMGPLAALLQTKGLPWLERMRSLHSWTYAPAQFFLTDALIRLASTPAMG